MWVAFEMGSNNKQKIQTIKIIKISQDGGELKKWVRNDRERM